MCIYDFLKYFQINTLYPVLQTFRDPHVFEPRVFMSELFMINVPCNFFKKYVT